MTKTTAAVIRGVGMCAGWGTFFVCAGTSACSAPAALPDAYVNTSGSGCGTLTAFGGLSSSANNLLPTTYPSGALQGKDTVNVQCQVSANGSGFSLSLYGYVAGGSTTITGEWSSSSPNQLTGVFESTVYGAYQAHNNCTLTPQFDSQMVPGTPIAPGFVWGHVSCPMAEQSGQVTTDSDAGSGAATCDIESDILFENCTR